MCSHVIAWRWCCSASAASIVTLSLCGTYNVLVCGSFMIRAPTTNALWSLATALQNSCAAAPFTQGFMNKLSACDGHVAKLVHPASNNAATPSWRTWCVIHGCGKRTAAAADAAGPVAHILILSPAAGGPCTYHVECVGLCQEKDK